MGYHDHGNRKVMLITLFCIQGNDVKHVVKGTWYAKEQYHFHMELQCVQVIPKEDGLDIYPATQWMDLNQIAISNVLNIPMNK